MAFIFSQIDTFPLELALWIVAAATVTQMLILLLTEFCGLPNPFVLGAQKIDDDNHQQAQGGAESDC